jgi:hypothetical protein
VNTAELQFWSKKAQANTAEQPLWSKKAQANTAELQFWSKKAQANTAELQFWSKKIQMRDFEVGGGTSEVPSFTFFRFIKYQQNISNQNTLFLKQT